MPSSVETELVEIFQRQVKELNQSADKYSTLEPTDISAILRTFSLAINRDEGGVTAQRLLDAISQPQ